MNKIIATVYNETTFEVLLKEHRSGYVDIKEIAVKYPLNVINIDERGQQKNGTPIELTETQLWDAAIERVQLMTSHGATHELLTIRRKDTRTKIVDTDLQASLLDEMREETDERFDRMLGR